MYIYILNIMQYITPFRNHQADTNSGGLYIIQNNM